SHDVDHIAPSAARFLTINNARCELLAASLDTCLSGTTAARFTCSGPRSPAASMLQCRRMPPRLIAMSDDARRSIDGEFVTIDRLQFRGGPDPRGPRTTRTRADVERRKGIVGQVNDVYLFEDPLALFHHISREPYLIDANQGAYYVVDRRSVC